MFWVKSPHNVPSRKDVSLPRFVGHKQARRSELRREEDSHQECLKERLYEGEGRSKVTGD